MRGRVERKHAVHLPRVVGEELRIDHMRLDHSKQILKQRRSRQADKQISREAEKQISRQETGRVNSKRFGKGKRRGGEAGEEEEEEARSSIDHKRLDEGKQTNPTANKQTSKQANRQTAKQKKQTGKREKEGGGARAWKSLCIDHMRLNQSKQILTGRGNRPTGRRANEEGRPQRSGESEREERKGRGREGTERRTPNQQQGAYKNEQESSNHMRLGPSKPIRMQGRNWNTGRERHAR